MLFLWKYSSKVIDWEYSPMMENIFFVFLEVEFQVLSPVFEMFGLEKVP